MTGIKAAFREADGGPSAGTVSVSVGADAKKHLNQIGLSSRVLAVVATASAPELKTETLRHIEMMQPLFNQVAVALSNAALFESAQREIAERKQVEEALRASEE